MVKLPTTRHTSFNYPKDKTALEIVAQKLEELVKKEPATNNYLDEGRPHREVIEMMALGFTGKLQQWWNNCLTEVSKEDIKYAIQKDEEGNPIINEIEQGIPDGVNTLIYTIMKHFIGKPSNITARIYEQLSNLRCKTLGDYKWYEDVFTTRVMHRRDCNSPFWKEKFINGLPTLFSQKVKETL